MTSGFAREQKILDLAVKLQLGTATADEVQDAADALSYAAGERLRLETRVGTLEEVLAFFMRVMSLFHYDSDIEEFLHWRPRATGNPIEFFFGHSSGEVEITPMTLTDLEKAFADVAAADGVSSYWALPLFVSRLLGEPIDPELRRHLPPQAAHLFPEVYP